VNEFVNEISAQFSVFVSDFSLRQERTKACISSQSYLLFFTTGTYQVLHTFPALSAIIMTETYQIFHKFPVLSAILHDGNVPYLP